MEVMEILELKVRQTLERGIDDQLLDAVPMPAGVGIFMDGNRYISDSRYYLPNCQTAEVEMVSIDRTWGNTHQ